jgi:elongation factor G
MTNIRNVALIGPYSSGKTTLLENLLYISGVITRKGSVNEGNTVGDASTEARVHKMSTEVTAAGFDYGGLSFTCLDCPGSVEFLQETLNVLVGVDAAIVVCEPDIQRVLTLAPLFQTLDEWEIPHWVFINKMDRVNNQFNDVVATLQQVSSRPLVLCQYPILQKDDCIGFIDLVTEEAFQYHLNAQADPIPLPEHLKEEEQQVHRHMLETLADFDDHLLEELLEDIAPSPQEVLQDVKQDLSADLIVPVLIGRADQGFGVRPLLEALVKETPSSQETATNRGFTADASQPIAQVLKTFLSPQGGKQSLVRIWQGQIDDSMILNEQRVGGLYKLFGSQTKSLGSAQAGEIVAINRLETVKTGDLLTLNGQVVSNTILKANTLEPVFCHAITADERKDEVKLSTALSKLTEEDPSITWEHRESTHEILLWGQGDIHLKVAIARLKRKYNLPVSTHTPHIPYCESIRKAAKSHGRYKHQTGGHGQFGDVYLEIQPQPRGSGFQFNETIVGGVVPKQYIPGVEVGVREYLTRGLHGFPIVDVSVTLTDGSYHSVDSSEQAFKQAARLAMQSGLPDCEPVLLEPVEQVHISNPAEYTSNVLRLITNRRGQILSYAAKPGWQGWDTVEAYLPMAEMQDLIIELRSLTQGVGFFQWEDDHLDVVPDKIAERVLAQTTAG